MAKPLIPDAGLVSPAPVTVPSSLVRRSGKIVINDPNGKILRTVFPGYARQALWDPVLDLLWILHDDKIEVVDMRVAGSTPVAIVDHVRKGATFAVRFGEGKRKLFLDQMDLCEGSNFGVVRIEWSGTPRLSFQGETPEDNASLAAARLIGGKWLKDNAGRTANEKRPRHSFAASKTKVPLPKRMGDCDDKSECGSSISFGDTGLQLVMTESTAGEDCRHVGCLLYDPATKLFADPSKPKEWKRTIKEPGDCGYFRFDQTNKDYYLLGQSICTVGDGCRSLHGETLGWLTPGMTLGLPTADTTVDEP